MATGTDEIPSVQSTHPSILRSRSTSNISTASTDSKSSNVTFAPLPQIPPRKRRNHRPIGLANRADMLRGTRHNHDSDPFSDYTGPFQYEDEDDIPLPDLGKLVKDIWRVMSRGHKKDKNTQEQQHSVPANSNETAISSAINEENGEGCVWMEEVTWKPPVPPSTPLLTDPITQEPNGDMTCGGSS